MVTSRAVVGSSAIRSLGSQARAIAIMTRWRRPPDSWWGVGVGAGSCGRGLSTSSSTSRARCIACSREAPRWSRTLSAIWRPIVIVGLSDVRGSWKIMPTSLPRIVPISLSAMGTMSRPSIRTEPAVMWPTFGRSFMIDRPVVVFPQPDSPTTPRHSPSSTWNETSSTAITVDRRSRNSVRNPSTSRTLVIAPPGALPCVPTRDVAPAQRTVPDSRRPVDGRSGRHRSAPARRRAHQDGGPSVQRKSGDVLLSQGISPQVPSALAVLTAVFGMGTGGSPPPWSPETDAPPELPRWGRQGAELAECGLPL